MIHLSLEVVNFHETTDIFYFEMTIVWFSSNRLSNFWLKLWFNFFVQFSEFKELVKLH